MFLQSDGKNVAFAVYVFRVFVVFFCFSKKTFEESKGSSSAIRTKAKATLFAKAEKADCLCNKLCVNIA